ncbi:cytochrome C [Candidatus Sulfurimonas marisnigri]|uniref:Cytochrome C n=1 Tax=Candidatus Sulfurimonas marisnigri TaxID=2740405 RepID=A0A7S7LZQ4_9BACT|nr:cytochrome c3 family protein [Candidatus Sulfurimonas marisnigri]QOY54441.1 cytochrome C [Candidatus Sulfurimonas marisnigri]
MRFIKLFVIGISFFASVSLFAGIVNTKHNLSVSNTGGTVKATSETEICVFCHTPHGAEPVGAPLWNRSMPASAYTMYDSDYLRRTGYPMPSVLGSANGEPGTISRQCLSCHDGTVAIGAITNAPGSGNGSDIAMGGVAGDGTMLSGSSAFIGTDLGKHHPVAVSYGETMTMPSAGAPHSQSASRGNELKATPDSPIVLREYLGYPGQKFVECISCHDPHKENGKFLRVDTGATHGQNIATTCMSCHVKDNFVGSTHDVKTATYTNSTVNTKFSNGASTKVSDMKCVNCHTPHNAGDDQYLTRRVQEQTCYQGASDTVSTAPCHGSGGASGGKDIETAMSEQYGHGFTLRNSNGNIKHTNLDYIYGAGVTNDQGPTSGIDWTSSQHVECMDCHNQHQVKEISRTLPGSLYPTNGAGTNLIVNGANEGPLKGASGVRPTSFTSTARWEQPTTFTTLETATYEYEVCFKCHSYWGIGADGANGDTMTNSPAHSAYVTFSDANVNFTDVAWEFNVNNRSGHPVNVALGSRTGSNSPKALQDSEMRDPWKSEGTQTMYCSDCHGAADETGTDPKGPHGSSYKFMLKGKNTDNYWPADSGGTLFKSGSSNNSGNNPGVFCRNCHFIEQGGPNHTERNEMNLECVRCHIAIPHGSPMSRLLGMTTFPAPYNYNGNKIYFTRIAKGSATWNANQILANGPSCSDKHRSGDQTGTAETKPTGW